MMNRNSLKQKLIELHLYELKDKFKEVLKTKLEMLKNNVAKQKDYHNLKSFFNMIELYDVADICEFLEYNNDEVKRKILEEKIKEVVNLLNE